MYRKSDSLLALQVALALTASKELTHTPIQQRGSICHQCQHVLQQIMPQVLTITRRASIAIIDSIRPIKG